MMSSRTLLKGSALGAVEPELVLSEVNDLLTKENDSSMFVTVCYAIYDLESGILDYANGGHNAPLIVRADGTAEYVNMPIGVALGVMPGIPIGKESCRLNKGDMILFYTDGVTEGMDESGELFGEDRLASFASGFAGSDAETFSTAVVKAVHDFAGSSPQSDDVTCVALKRRE